MYLIIDDFLPKEMVYEFEGIKEHANNVNRVSIIQRTQTSAAFYRHRDRTQIDCFPYSKEHEGWFDRYFSKLDYVVDTFFEGATGCNGWVRSNIDMGWHVDRDECEFFKGGKDLRPICSALWYQTAELKGREGRLVLLDDPGYDTTGMQDRQGKLTRELDPSKMMHIIPKTNRLVLLWPDVVHCCTPINSKGDVRFVFACSYWDRRIDISNMPLDKVVHEDGIHYD